MAMAPVFIPEVALGSIAISPTNPRRTFNPVFLQELAESIGRTGVVQPIVLRTWIATAEDVVRTRKSGLKPKFGPGDNVLQLVAGEQRLRASVIAGKEDIPAIVRELTNKQALEIQLIENLKRSDVHPLDEGNGLKTLLALEPEPGEEKATVESIAAEIGKSPAYIYGRLQFAQLIPPIQQAFYEGKIHAGHATEICRLQAKAQERVFMGCFGGERITDEDGNFTQIEYKKPEDVLKDQEAVPNVNVRQLRSWIKDKLHINLSHAPFDVADATLAPEAGACTECPKRTGSNPLLFADVKNGQTCTDPDCYETKKAAFVQIKLEDVKKDTGAKKVQKIAEENYHWNEKKPADVLEPSAYKVATPKCEKTKPAVYVKGDHLGQAATLCVDDSCAEHNGQSRFQSPAPTPEEKKKRDAENLKSKIESTFRNDLLLRIHGELPQKLGDQEIRFLAEHTMQRLHHDGQKALVKFMAWPKVGKEGPEEIILRETKQMTTAELGKMMLVSAAALDLQVSQYDSGLDKERALAKLAGMYGFNLKDERDAVKEKLEGEAKDKADKKKTAEKKKSEALGEEQKTVDAAVDRIKAARPDKKASVKAQKKSMVAQPAFVAKLKAGEPAKAKKAAPKKSKPGRKAKGGKK